MLHVHQALVGDRLDLVRRQHAVRAAGRRRRTPRRAALRFHGAGDRTGRAAVGADAGLRRGLLLGQPLLLAEFGTSVLEPHLQQPYATVLSAWNVKSRGERTLEMMFPPQQRNDLIKSVES